MPVFKLKMEKKLITIQKPNSFKVFLKMMISRFAENMSHFQFRCIVCVKAIMTFLADQLGLAALETIILDLTGMYMKGASYLAQNK